MENLSLAIAKLQAFPLFIICSVLLDRKLVDLFRCQVDLAKFLLISNAFQLTQNSVLLFIRFSRQVFLHWLSVKSFFVRLSCISPECCFSFRDLGLQFWSDCMLSTRLKRYAYKSDACVCVDQRGGFRWRLFEKMANTSHLTNYITQNSAPHSVFGQFHYKLPINSTDSMLRCELKRAPHFQR